MLETIEKRILELQGTARQHEAVLLQITGAIQELTKMASELKGANDAVENGSE